MLYDRAFRRRAEMTKDLNWSVVNTSLFNLCFGGRARRRAICQLCLSEHHTTERCPRRVLAWGSTLAYSAAIDGGSLPCLSSHTLFRHSPRWNSVVLQGFGPWSRAVQDPGVQWWRWGETPSSGMKGTVAHTPVGRSHLTCNYHVMSCMYGIVMLWMCSLKKSRT